VATYNGLFEPSAVGVLFERNSLKEYNKTIVIYATNGYDINGHKRQMDR
jgi:phosphoenolpyruvate synthase/pyruvate phosphate dikinase